MNGTLPPPGVTFPALAAIPLPPVSPLLLMLLFAGLLTALLLFIVLRLDAARRLRESNRQLAECTHRLALTSERCRRQELRAAKLLTLWKSERRHAAARLRQLGEAREELRLQFGQLARQIFDEKAVRFSELNRERLSAILNPFQQQLLALKEEIENTHRHDSHERISLQTEIFHLRELNQQINQEAINLTRALQGDNKVQGNWGEMVLERVLERSGLRRGHEYHCQGGFRDPDNRLLKPDVIIHLPTGREIIVDSKVSLASWQRYVNCHDEAERADHLVAHVKAVRDHITTLADKNYPAVAGVNSLDFVLMFMPIEAAFHAAFEHEPRLLDEAITGNVVVVTPTALLATLRSIENIWRFEQQSRNSLEIARRAGLMYDRFRAFVEDLDKLGRQLASCQSSYEAALLRLTRGRGNLIAQAEQLRDLGVQVKKELPRTVTDQAEITPNETPPTP